jgi:hypothetical protein
MLSGRLEKWAMLLLQFDIKYVSQIAAKGQVLAAHPIPDVFLVDDDLPD